MKIDKTNVGKIGERIVMNELAARGFAVTDLNKDGVSANADIIAVRARRAVQIQVKSATNEPASKWWSGKPLPPPESGWHSTQARQGLGAAR